MTIAVCHSSQNDPFVIPARAREQADDAHAQYSIKSQSDHIALVNAYVVRDIRIVEREDERR